MGVDPISLAAIGAAGSSLFNAYTSNKNQGYANNRNDLLAKLVMGQMQGGPSALEQQIGDQIGPANRTAGQVYNTGQDSILQLLRPGGALNRTANTGDPFDLSQQFAANRTQDQLQTTDALSALNGQVRGLGQRYGSANQTATSRLLAQLTANRGVRDATIANQAFESAANRKLQAGGLIGQLTGQANQDQLSGYSLLAQLQGQRQGLNAQLLGLLGGVPSKGAPDLGGLGGGVGDIGQLLLLHSLLGSK